MRRLYKFLPTVLQNLVLTLKNNQVYFIKYGTIPIIRSLKSHVRKISSYERKVLNAVDIQKEINELLEYATTKIPYYIQNSVEYPRLKELNDIKNLSISNKKTFLENQSDIISPESNFFNSYSFKTSGSTGTPLKGKLKIKSLRKTYISFLKALNDFGIDYSKRVARFSGAEIANEKQVYRKDFINNHFFVSIYHIKQQNAQKYYDFLVKEKVEILEGYPSTLYSLTKIISDFDIKKLRIKHVLTTAEKLHDHQKEYISNTLGADVFDFYGSSEGSSFIYTCSHNRYHVDNNLSFLEILDSDGNDVLPGKEGKMVVTSFGSFFTPLIRYDIGDNCRVSKNQQCDCGNGGILIDEIIGRDDEAFITPDGRFFSRFSLCLKYLPDSIITSQIELQQKSYDVTINYTLNESNDLHEKLDFTPFENKFSNMLGLGYNFTYRHVKSIPKKANGKHRTVLIE